MTRWTKGWVAASAGAALAALWMASVGGCFQASGLGDITFAQPEGGTACTGAAQCDDQNPCTTDTCDSTGVCTHAAAPDGPLPAAEQVPGDCKQIVCKGGVSDTIADPSDPPKPPDTCTATSCDGDTPAQKPQPDGTACTLSGAAGECKGGSCTVACKVASDCPSKGPCQAPSCNGATGTCEYADVADGTPTPGMTQTPGTCKTWICLMGASADQVDDTNVPPVPVAMAGCATAKCTDGTPSFPLNPVDSPCSTWMGTMPGFCDSAGACSQCTQDNQCPGTTTDCQHPACTNDACTTSFTTKATPTTTNPPQIAGDCLEIVCDGNGGTMTIPEPTDVPPPTNNGCTLGTCSAQGVPGTTPLTPAGMPCGNGLSCTTAGLCAGCTLNSQCQPPANEICTAPNCVCVPYTCATTPPDKTTCGSGISNGCGGTLDCDDAKQDGNETDVDCGGASNANGACATRCAQGKKCNATTDCAGGLTCADGVCCNQACAGACEACTALKKGQGTDGVCGAVAAGLADPHGICTSQAASTCGDMGGTCNGSGACTTWPGGTQCVPPSCAGGVLTKAETCIAGVCTALVPATQACSPYACNGTTACYTSCTADADCASGDYCKGTACVATLGQGAACTADDQCASMFCVSGFCCDSACNTRCQACSAMLTGGVNGTCGSVLAGDADPTGHCVAAGATTCGEDGNCTAAGLCQKYAAGTVCVAASCSAGTETTEGTCNGTGTCAGSTMSPCTPYVCGATACLTSCTSAANCISGDVCTMNTCMP